MNLEGTTVAVFGAYGLIGTACAHTFREAGAQVHLVGRDRAKLEALARELGETTTFAARDVASPDDARAALDGHGPFAAIATPIGGPAPSGPIAEAAADEVVEAMRGKLLSQWAVAGAADGALQPGGALVLFSGLLARFSMPGMNALGTVNAAVERLAQSLDAEMEGRRVRCISPGIVKDGADASKGESLPSEVAALAVAIAREDDDDNAVIRDIPEGLAPKAAA